MTTGRWFAGKTLVARRAAGFCRCRQRLRALILTVVTLFAVRSVSASDPREERPVTWFQGPRVLHVSYVSDWSDPRLSPRPLSVEFQLVRPDGRAEVLLGGSLRVEGTNRVSLPLSGHYELRRVITYPGKPTNTLAVTTYQSWNADFTKPTGITGTPQFSETFSAEKVSLVDVNLAGRVTLALDSLTVEGSTTVACPENGAGTIEVRSCRLAGFGSVFAAEVRIEDTVAADGLGTAGWQRVVLRNVRAAGALGAGGSVSNVVLVSGCQAPSLSLHGGMVNAERVQIDGRITGTGRTLSLRSSRVDGALGCRLEAREVLQVSENDFYPSSAVRLMVPPAGLYLLNNVFLSEVSYEWPTLTGRENLAISGNSFWNPAALGIHRVEGDFVLPGAYALDGNFWGDPAGPAREMPLGGDWLGSAAGGCGQLATNVTWLPSGRETVSGLGSPFQSEVVWLRNVAAGQNVIAPGYVAIGRQDRRTLVSFDLRTVMGEVPAGSFHLVVTGDDGATERVLPVPRGQPLRRYYADPATARPLDFIVSPRPGYQVTYVLHQQLSNGEDRVLYRGSYTQTPPPARPLRIGLRFVTINAWGYNREFTAASRPEQDPATIIHDRLTTAMAALLPLRKRQDIRIEVLPATEYSPLFSGLISLRHNSIYFGVARALQQQFDAENAARQAAGRPRLDLLLGVVPQGALSENTGSTGFNHRRYPTVAVIEETEPEAAIHEFGHAFGLCPREQYALPTGWNLADPCSDAGGFDYCDIYVENTAGARFWGASLFAPDEELTYGPIPGGIRHAPAGVVSGVRDIMGAQAADVMLPATHFAFTAALTQLLGWQFGGGGTAPAVGAVPGTFRALAAPPAATRRIALEGLVFAVTNTTGAGGLILRIAPESLVCRVVPSGVAPFAGADRLYLRLRAFDDAGVQLGQWECLRGSAGDPSSEPLRWYQTFDVPVSTRLLQLETSTLSTVSEFLRPLPGDWQPRLTATAGVDAATRRIGPSFELDFGLTEPADAPRSLGVTLLVSGDGGVTWDSLGNFDGATEARLARDGLPVSDQLMFKLAASDGFQTRESVVGPFRREAAGPGVEIVLPWAEAAAPPSITWTLAARVAAAEAPAWVRWSSSRDGALGAGERLDGVKLTPGPHRLTCTAADSAGRLGSNSVDVIVREESDSRADLRITGDALTLGAANWDRARGHPSRPQTGRECEAVVDVRNPGVTNVLRLQLLLQSPGSAEYLLAERLVTNGPLESAVISGRFTPVARGIHRLRARAEFAGPSSLVDPDLTNNERTWSFTNEPPVARGFVVRASSGQAVELGLDGADPDGDPLTFEVTRSPQHGILMGTAPELRYQAATNYTGPDAFTFRVSDGAEWSAPVTVPIRVRGASPYLPVQFRILGRANQPLQARIPAEGQDLIFSAPMLPFLFGGLKLDARSGVVTGTVPGPVTNWVPVSVTNSLGLAQLGLEIVILANAAPPVVTSPGELTGTAGTGLGYQITADNGPQSYLATGLPAGLTLNPWTGAIGGVPLNSGVFTASVGASNVFGLGWKSLTITVQSSGQPPVFTRLLDTFVTLGQPMSAALGEFCANNPVRWEITGLPPGVSLDSNTGELSGTPRAAGHFNPTITARNAAGVTASTFSLTVLTPAGLPVVVGAGELAGTVGVDFRWNIRASETPTRFGAEGLPPGLSADPTTGLISGRPTTPGSYAVRCVASNRTGEGATMVSFLILPNPLGPLLGDAVFADARLGGSIDFVPVALNQPTHFWAVDLPRGVVIDPLTGHLTGRFEVAGRRVATLMASNRVGRASARLHFAVAPEFAGWTGVVGLAGAAADPGADPDLDGYPNLLEYALGGDPGLREAAPLLHLERASDEIRVVLYFRVWSEGSGNVFGNYEAGGVRYEVEVAPSAIGPWRSDPDAFDPAFDSIPQDDGRDLLALPLLRHPGENARFVRVRVRPL